MAQESREALERRWEGSMIRGEAFEYAEGGRIPDAAKNSFEQARGSVAAARLTNRGIGVADFRGPEALGLIRGVGWHMYGGLLGRQPLDGATLELYGKEVTRKRGGFLGFDTYHKLEDVSYKFFLLRRPPGGGNATTLAKWGIPPEDIAWDIPAPSAQYPALAHGEAGARSDVRGFLAYDPVTKTATVTITGLKRPFEERITGSNT